jgi:hypothetical protein
VQFGAKPRIPCTVLHGVMMVAMSAAMMMEDMTVADVGTGAFPPPMWM